jgi:hypothetical protein
MRTKKLFQNFLVLPVSVLTFCAVVAKMVVFASAFLEYFL